MFQMRKKIMFIVPNLRYGGASKVISLISQGIPAEKFEVLLVTINTTEAFYKVTKPGVRLISLDTNKIRQSIKPLKKLLRKEHPDIVFCNGQDLNILLSALRFLFRFPFRLVCRETSILSGNNKGIKYAGLYNFLVKKLYNKIDVLICQSDAMKEDLQKNYAVQAGRLMVIPNPVQVPAADFTQSLFLEGKLKLLTIGRLVPEKGMLRVFHSLTYLSQPWQLIVLGDGNQMEELKREAERPGLKGNIVFKGFVQNTNAYIADCDYLLFGTYNEGFPNIVLEAGILGKPLIAFKALGVDEAVIEDEVTGLLVKENDPASFAGAIVKAQNINFDRQLISDKITNKFGLPNIISRYEQLFEQLTDY